MSSVRLGPESGGTFSSQVIAVLDTGVYRQHKDFVTGLSANPGPGPSLGIKGKISWIGVDVSDHEIWVGTKLKLRGEPDVYDETRQGMSNHGTAMAGMISAGTHDPSFTSGTIGTGTAGLAPSALILPVRLRILGGSNGIPLTISSSSMVKSIRAIRFNFGHTKWAKKIRVVNMSFGGGKISSWWSPNDMLLNISRDLKYNDRLYIAGAGNQSTHKLVYPAAYSNVLGVTGALASRLEDGINWHFDVDPLSNYWDIVYRDVNAVYAVSGIYGFANEFSGCQALPSPPGLGYENDSAIYDITDGGTSSAAAQISALAFLLYDAKARQTGNVLASSYPTVRNRIINTQMALLIDENNPNHRMAGVANFMCALNAW